MKEHAKAFLMFGAFFCAWVVINKAVPIPVAGPYLPGGANS